jgi:hypothetical protein
MSAQDMLNQLLDACFPLALEGSSSNWDSFVRSLGLTPLTQEQRRVIRSAGVPQLKGVLPVELRVVLEAIHARVSTQPDVSFIAMELDTFVERELMRFIAAAQPAKAALAGIFANAHRSAIKTVGVDSISTVKCNCCGAARPANSELSTCTFCGSALL